MIGGTIINIEEFKDKIRLDLVDDKTKDKLSVYVELSAAAKCVQEGHLPTNKFAGLLKT